MRLSSLINEDHVLIDLPATTLAKGVDALVDLIADDLDEGQLAAIRSTLERRRADRVDYLERGVAIPHARVEGLDRFFLCVGTSKKGLSVSDDGGEAHLVFLVLTPQAKNTLMLQTLAAIMRLCRNNDTRGALRSCRTPSRLIKLVEESDVDVKRTVTASDAMRPCEYRLSPKDDLTHVLDLLVETGERSLPLVDTKGKITGTVTPGDLFGLGLPKYVNILSNVDFLTNFEPFEKVFINEKKLTAGEIGSQPATTVERDAPIIHVAHLLVEEKAPVVYVIDDHGKVCGVIDERDILRRVLNP